MSRTIQRFQDSQSTDNVAAGNGDYQVCAPANATYIDMNLVVQITFTAATLLVPSVQFGGATFTVQIKDSTGAVQKTVIDAADSLDDLLMLGQSTSDVGSTVTIRIPLEGEFVNLGGCISMAFDQQANPATILRVRADLDCRENQLPGAPS